MKTFIRLMIFVIATSCSGNRSKETKEELSTSELWEKELQKQDRAVNGIGNYEVDLIKDPIEINNILKRIEKKELLEKRINLEKSSQKSLGQRYKDGDKSVVDELISLMAGPMSDEKNRTFIDLGPSWNDDQYTIVETELINVILNNIERGGDEEKRAVQLAGILRINGYSSVFEKRLLSGESDEEGRLLYWLAQDGKSFRTVDYIFNKLKQNYVSDEFLSDAFSALASFCENGNPKIIKMAVEASLDVYNRNLIEEEKFDEIRHSYSSANPAIDLLSILFHFGDERVIPIAQKYYEKDILRVSAMNCLLRLDGSKYVSDLRKLLDDKESILDGFKSMVFYCSGNDCNDLIKKGIQNFEKFNIYNKGDNAISNLLNSLDQIDSSRTLEWIKENATNKSFYDHCQVVQKIEKTSAKEVADFIYQIGLVNEKIKENILNDLGSFYGYDAIYNVLGISGIVHSFDSEPGIIPVDYDVLIYELIKCSKGKLNGLKVYMDIGHEEQYENIPYEITAVFKNVGFRFKPEDLGDWYDVSYTLYFMNTILTYFDIDERYVLLDDGDQFMDVMFGKEELIEEFKKQYRWTEY